MCVPVGLMHGHTRLCQHCTQGVLLISPREDLNNKSTWCRTAITGSYVVTGTQEFTQHTTGEHIPYLGRYVYSQSTCVMLAHGRLGGLVVGCLLDMQFI